MRSLEVYDHSGVCSHLCGRLSVNESLHVGLAEHVENVLSYIETGEGIMRMRKRGEKAKKRIWRILTDAWSGSCCAYILFHISRIAAHHSLFSLHFSNGGPLRLPACSLFWKNFPRDWAAANHQRLQIHPVHFQDWQPDWSYG